MRIGRAIGAHFAAVLLSSLVLIMGIEAVVHGTVGSVEGIGKWIGGIAIFLTLALISLPVGLMLRVIVGRSGVAPMRGALLGGVLVGGALLFVLHPGMYPGVSVQTKPVGLVLIHIGAGLTGGWVWHRCEFGFGGESVG